MAGYRSRDPRDREAARASSILEEARLLLLIAHDIALEPAEKHKQLSKARRLMLEQFVHEGRLK